MTVKGYVRGFFLRTDECPGGGRDCSICPYYTNNYIVHGKFTDGALLTIFCSWPKAKGERA